MDWDPVFPGSRVLKMDWGPIICGGTARYGHWGPILGYGTAKYGHWGPKYGLRTFKNQFWGSKFEFWMLFWDQNDILNYSRGSRPYSGSISIYNFVIFN